MDLTMESDAMSEISEISTATSTRSKKLRFGTKKQKQLGKDQQQPHSEPTSKSSSILTLSRRSGNKKIKSQDQTMSDDLTSPTSLTGRDVSVKEESAIRFSGNGVTFKAKLIGIDPVAGPRGDQMCKNAMTRLKAIVKGTGSHKKKILLSISLDGLRLMDEKSREEISHHPIPLISYISRDTSDTRAFGFVYGSPSEGHQFIGIKTEKAAIPVMQTIADLFTYVYEKRKKEKMLIKDNGSSTSSPPRTSESAVLSFGAKEEFSTEKVNAAWTRTEPIRSQQKPSAATTGTGMVPMLPLPPPGRSESLSSRTSTMSSMQRSEVLNELRSMRHVINSARDATNSSDNNNRYATWESFDENNANDTISQMNSQVSAEINPHPLSLVSHRSASQRTLSSDTESVNQKSFTSGRLAHPAVLPSGVLVPSPPSSPRSTCSRSNRLRRGRGIDQPNQVALPPISANSFTQSSAVQFNARPPLQQMFPAAVTSFPTRSEPDLFADKRDKFEANFEAVFSKSSLGPTPISSNAMPKPVVNNQQTDPNDRYACFQEIQNLDTFPSIFDNHSSSDSDTFVGSPLQSSMSSASAPPDQRNEAKSNPQTDLFGSSNWSAPPQACAISFPPPLVPVPVNQNDSAMQQHPSDENQFRKMSAGHPNQFAGTAATAGADFTSGKNNAILKDTATSPGTPPHLVSATSQEQFSHNGARSRSSPSHDPFSSLEFADLQPIKKNMDSSMFFQDVRNPPKHTLSEMENQSTQRGQTAEMVMTNRVGTERRGSQSEMIYDSTRFSSPHTSASRDRPPSSASAASGIRNPFAPDDFDDVRSTHSENESAYSSCATPASAYHTQQSAAGHMPRHFAKHAAAAPFHPMPVMNHRFDAFAYPATPFPYPSNMSSAFDAQFQRSAPTPQMMCHHMTNPAGQMHQVPSNECDCRFFFRHPDPRVADMYQHPDPRYQYFQRMQQMYQQKSAPTEFGSSFEFDPDFDASSSSSGRPLDCRQMSQFSFPHAHHDRDPFAPSSDSRCLSPNNPFNPIFGTSERMMSAMMESQYGMIPPPRPPTRIPDMRRSSCESENSPPPLPKRRTQPHQPQPQHNYHNAPRDYEIRNVYACPPGEQSHGSAAESPPPLPLPSRKKPASISRTQFERRVSFDTPPKSVVDDPNDPFNVSFIEKHLSQVSVSNHNSSQVTSAIEKSKKIQTSTPLTSESGNDHKKPLGLQLSSIRSVSEAEQTSAIGLNDSSVFESSSSSSGFDSGGYKRLTDDQSRHNIQNTELSESLPKSDHEAKECVTKGPFHHFGDDHISPEERNIFRSKDPFENDDFFAS